jgi:spore coat protein CotH
LAIAALGAVLVLTGCASDADPALTDVATTQDTTTEDTTSSATVLVDDDVDTVFDASEVHEISIDFDDADYAAMIDAYLADGSKEWIEATVTIDETTYRSVGVRLKGNSSLRGLGSGQGVSDQVPEELPWLIKLDKYLDGQSHDGVHDFVVRSNNSETSLNEALALELLEAAGLASQDAIAVRFSVNDSDAQLRLVIEHPDDVWLADNFDSSDALFKAESTGDYSYRGDDPDAYDEVFDQEAGKSNTDLQPLIEFLDFINNADDETFAAEIDEWLDVDEFATYLAMQDLIQNFDDIDGPGNNTYLHWDADTGRFTVVAWDHNLSFGDAGFGLGGGQGGGGQGGGRPGFGDVDGAPVRPDGGDGRPAQGGAAAQTGPGGADGPGGSNVLVERLSADADFAALLSARTAELTTALIDSGFAAEVLAEWTAVLQGGASDLVSADVIADESARLAAVV